ncbi:MAG: hypothetical protein H6510_03960 [Acidobacteria bacterium]|nr:hypothetical protein [Acidobacteriota bacterium]MCB9396950.1 hypothetical protein [Acidobacteriota bacterium]
MKIEFSLNYLGMVWAERFDHPIREYEQVQSHCGWMPLPLATLAVQGKDAASFLQGLGSQDFLHQKIGTVLPSFFLDASGKILFLVQVARNQSGFLIQVATRDLEPLQKHLDKYLIMEDVRLTPQPLQWITLQGPDAGRLRDILPAESQSFEHDRTGLGGYDCAIQPETLNLFAEQFQAKGVVAFGLTALDILRTEAFLPWLGIEIQPGQNPLLYGQGNRISYSKGCFLGQETVAMTRDRGRPPRILCQVEGQFEGFPQVDQPLFKAQDEVGILVSGHYSPKLNKPLAFAMVKTIQAQKDTALTDPAGNTWMVRQVAAYKDSP